MRSGDGFLCVYSVTLRSSFEEVANFRDQILRVKDSDDIPTVIVGNKIDMVADRKVSTEEGQKLAEQMSASPFLCLLCSDCVLRPWYCRL
jgi:GTPase KRas protein